VGSADPMPRNLNRRVEVLFPIEDKALKREIVDVILATYLRDNQQAHVLQADGSYRPLRHELGANDESFSSQDGFIEEHRVEYSGD
jgi:polyphosphate kinase